MYTVIKEDRNHWQWVVTWNGGKSLCRANSERDANRIAAGMNISRETSENALDMVMAKLEKGLPS